MPTTGRMSRRRPATCCFTPTVSPGAQCRSRRTVRGRYAAVHTASSPAPKERLTWTSTVHFMEPDSREHSTHRGLGVAALSQLGAIATVYVINGKSLVPKDSQWNNSRCTFLIKGSLQPPGTSHSHTCKASRVEFECLKSQLRRKEKKTCS